jgi:hypothetical protein
MDTLHTNNQPNPDAERLSDIISRVGKYVEAQHTDPTATQTTPQPAAQPDEQPNLPIAVPNVTLPIPPEYIRSEAFLEVSGFFTPASKRIENIFIKEKKLREYTDDQGNKKILKTTIRASHGLGLPITSDLD